MPMQKAEITGKHSEKRKKNNNLLKPEVCKSQNTT